MRKKYILPKKKEINRAHLCVFSNVMNEFF